ncbi:MAG: sensor domain-containing diguanylate cyclase [bacterium]
MEKKYFKNIIISFAVIFILSIILHRTLINDAAMNWTCLLFAVLILIYRTRIGKVKGIIVFFIAIFLALIMFGMREISKEVCIVSMGLYTFIFFLKSLMRKYFEEIETFEKQLEEKQRERVAIEKSYWEEETQHKIVAGETKKITQLYGTLKEMNKLTLDSMAEVIGETVMKIVRYSFSASLEEVRCILLLKKETDFYIAYSFGYEEELLRVGQMKTVSEILRYINDNKDLMIVEERQTSGVLEYSGIGSKSVLYQPLYVGDKLRGVLMISSNKNNIFNEKQIGDVRILASQAALALEKVYLYEEIAHLSITDSLTGLYVHRYFQEKLESEIGRSAKDNKEISVIMSDIDFFKKVNDVYGHAAGDYVLKTIGLILKINTTSTETIARYGGEEFVIVLPETDKTHAIARAEMIRKTVEDFNFKFNGTDIKITLSLGVATLPVDAMTRRELIGRADQAMYVAKLSGRNRVETAGFLY